MKIKFSNNIFTFSALFIAVIFGLTLALISLTPVNTAQACYGNCGYYGYNTYPATRPIFVGDMFSNRTVQPAPVPVTYPVVVPVPAPQPSPVYYPVYQQTYPVYYNTYNYPNLSVTCTSNVVSTTVGNYITWNASVSGGNGIYTYTWSGTDSLYGYNASVSKNYYTTGYKYAYVTVYSAGQSVQQTCGNSVLVYDQYYYNTNPTYVTYNVPTSNNINVACYVDPQTSEINQPVTWTAEVSGGLAPYAYSWSGSDDISGTNSSVLKYYSTSGTKSALVTVTSADGRSTTKACSNTLSVKSNYVRPARTVPVVTPTVTVTPSPTPTSQANNQSLSAASLFSLSNIPWGWVAVLIILVLFATVMYLVFNRNKI